MFASLSSFLPSALLQPSQPARPLQPARPPDVPSTSLLPAPVVDLPRKKERKEKHANEAFIIVRPPPSKSAHPLSLQVQLIPPQSRHDQPLRALDSSPDDLNTDLTRTQSNRSESSNYSGYTSSTGSLSSFVSTSTTSSGRRMIIPLYNLHVHSVMPTTILDAGTDAKVAKFAKRGLEVIGLAFFESIEVRPSTPAHDLPPPSVSARPSLDDSLREFGLPSALPPSRHPFPDRPHTSHSTVNGSKVYPLKPTINVIPAPPLPPPDLQPQRSTKKLFAKMFRRRDNTSPLSIAVHLPDETVSSQPSPFRDSARRSDETPVSQSDTHYYDTWPSAPLTSTTASQTAVLGVHSTLYPPVSNPNGRPTKYIWVVRKWLKGSDTGVLNGVMGKFSVGARDASISDTPHIEVRFEWFREQKKRAGRKSRVDKRLSSRESRSPSRHRTPTNNLPRIAPQSLVADVHDHRSSIISHISSSSDTPTSSNSSAHRHSEESDEESDPEDSETPWTCTVIVQRLGQSLQYHSDGVRDSVVRLKVATLTPTPHHPKLVGLLKAPFPLPDIELEHLAVRPRLVTAHGIKTTMPNAGGFVLTAEEIKDTVSSTALWLVVREAFGGVGRERKKGKS